MLGMWKATNYADLTVCCLPQGFLARNITDVCFTSTPGVDDLLCQAIEENTFIDLIESTTFPVSICHSPNDDLVPIGHAPDVSINPMLSKLTLLGQGPTAGHFESSFLCQMAFILQFTVFGSAPAPLSGIEPLTGPSLYCDYLSSQWRITRDACPCDYGSTSDSCSWTKCWPKKRIHRIH